MRRVILAAMLLAPAALLSPLRAQSAPELEVELLSFPTWVGPEDSLRAVLEVTNNSDVPAQDIRVALTVHQGVTSRSVLERTFEGTLGGVLVADSIQIGGTIQPGRSRELTIDAPLNQFRYFQGFPPNRAHPVRLTVLSNEEPAEPIDVHMIFFNEPALVPLELGLVIPITARPPFDPSGSVLAEDVSGVIGGGRVTRILDALEANPGAQVILAPGASFLETLDELADGYVDDSGGEPTQVSESDEPARRAASELDRLLAEADSPGRTILLTPYSSAHLTWLVRQGLADRAVRQIIRAKEVLESNGLNLLDDWLLPPEGRLDDDTVASIEGLGISSVVVSANSVTQKTTRLTEPAPATLLSRGDRIDAVITDAGLEERLRDASGGPIVARQRFLAETAAIHLERPSIQRSVFAITPLDWDAHYAQELLAALEVSPWMRGATLNSASGEVSADLDLLPAEEVAAGLTAPARLGPILASATMTVADFAQLEPPAGLLDEFAKRLMFSEGGDWWTTSNSRAGAERQATSVIDDVEAELNKIRSPPDQQTITLTSRTGTIPLALGTTTSYAVDVKVRLVSDKLSFPEGTEFQVELTPPVTTLDVQAIAETSGTFPLQVIVETPEGTRTIAESTIAVRSTAFNVVAVAITAGAGIFLVGWWLVSVYRRRLQE